MKFILIALLALAGCATTSDELVETREPFHFNSRSSPSVAIGCVARNYENTVPTTVSVREGPKPGEWEATARTPQALFAMLYATARPAIGGGSNVSVWISQRTGVETLVEKTKSGC